MAEYTLSFLYTLCVNDGGTNLCYEWDGNEGDSFIGAGSGAMGKNVEESIGSLPDLASRFSKQSKITIVGVPKHNPCFQVPANSEEVKKLTDRLKEIRPDLVFVSDKQP